MESLTRRWCSGIMQDSHSCDPGSIPGRRTRHLFFGCQKIVASFIFDFGWYTFAVTFQSWLKKGIIYFKCSQ